MRIAILGATSQIAKDLVLCFSVKCNYDLALFARRPGAVKQWLLDVGLGGRYSIAEFGEFGINENFDAIINFVGSGNPAQIAAMGASILDVTLKYDEMALAYVRHHPECRYLFLSSGAAYGSSFDEPVDINTKAEVAINDLQLQDLYGVAKMYAECRHRALPHLPIMDIRVFNYFSHRQDISARFFITDLIRAIHSGERFITSNDNIVRDYIGPDDFSLLVELLLQYPATNDVVDCFTCAPVDKMSLLKAMEEHYGLLYELGETHAGVNATGLKVNYFSRNYKAETYGFYPSKNSLDTIFGETQLMLDSLIQQ